MVTSLGHGAVPEILKAVVEQTEEISFLYNVHATTPAQETLARDLIDVAPDGFTHAHFVSGGTEANELALRMVPQLPRRARAGGAASRRIAGPGLSWCEHRDIRSDWQGRTAGPVSALHPTAAAHPAVDMAVRHLGRRGVACAGRRTGAGGRSGRGVPDRAGQCGVAAGLLHRRKRFGADSKNERREHGFLVWFDEVVTGLGRTGTWFAADQMPLTPDIIATAKGLGAGYSPRRCDARAPACVSGSRRRIGGPSNPGIRGMGAAVVRCRFGGVGPSGKDGTRRCRP